jgi:hypothetical protein
MPNARKQEETRASHAIREAVVKLGLALLWRNNVGVASYGPFSAGKVRYGLGIGSADLVGVMIGTGRFVAIEVKSPTGRQSTEQKLWGEAVRRAGGIYLLARTPEEAVAGLVDSVAP